MAVNGSIQLAYQDTAWFAANPTLVLLEGQHVYLSDGSDEFLSAYVVGDGVTELQDLPWKGLIYPSGVQSVTGPNVDDTDPFNPIVNEQQVMYSPDTNTYISVTNNNLAYILGGNGTNYSSLAASSLGVELNDNNLAGSKPLMLDVNKRIKGLTAAIWGSFIVALTGKTTPIDADSINISDSAASGTAKKVSLTNFKAFLKTYFDTIYTTTSAVATQITTALSGYLTAATAASTYVAKTTWIDISSTVTITGFSGTPTVSVWYKINDGIVTVLWSVTGTSSATNFIIDNLPFTINASQPTNYVACRVTNNGVGTTVAGRARLEAGTNLLVIQRNLTGTLFTASGTKTSEGQIIGML